MTFRTVRRTTGLSASRSPFRVVDEQERELEWINRFLDMQCVRGIAPLTLRSYANMLLHFVRWWSPPSRGGRDALHGRSVHRIHAGRLCARPAR